MPHPTRRDSPCTPPVLAAAQYYWDHLGQQVPVVVLSDRLAGAQGAEALTQQLQRLQVCDGAQFAASSAPSVASGASSAALSSLSSHSGSNGASRGHGGFGAGGGLQHGGAAAEEAHRLQTTRQRLLAQGGVVVMSAAEGFATLYGHSQAVTDLCESLLQARIAKEAEAEEEAGPGQSSSGSPLKGAGAQQHQQGQVAAGDAYPAHWSQVAIEEGLQEGLLVQVRKKEGGREECTEPQRLLRQIDVTAKRGDV